VSSPGFTPPGPPIEPFRAYAGSEAAATEMPADPAQWYAPYQPVVRRPGGLATAALVLSTCLWVLEVLQALTASGATDPEAFLPAYDLISLPFWPLALACYIVTCIWLQRSRQFAEAYRPGDPQEYGLAWLWLSWLVPIAALVVPFRVVRDVYRTSQRWPASIRLIGLWWWCWPTWQFTSFVAVRMRLDGSESFPAAEAVGAVLFTGALACWVTIVRRIDRGQGEQERAGLPQP